MDEASRTVELTRLSDIAVLDELQVRGGTYSETVNRYRRAMQAGEVFPNILVGRLKGALLLLDGFHRLAAMQALGVSDADADVVELPDMTQAKWLAGQGNLRHGVQLTARERRALFRSYIEAGEHIHRSGGRKGRPKSYREMERDLPGVAHTTLRNWTKAEFPVVFAEMSSPGREGAHEGVWSPNGGGMDVLSYRATQAAATLESLLPALPEAVRWEIAQSVQRMRANLNENPPREPAF